MEAIYQSFDDLVKKNQSIFKLIEKGGHRGLYKAIWDARQAEIDDLKLKLQGTQKNTLDLKNKLQLEVKKNEKLIPEFQLENESKLQKLQSELEQNKEKLAELEAYNLALNEELQGSAEYVKNLRDYAEKSNIFAEQAGISATYAEREKVEAEERAILATAKELNYQEEIAELKSLLEATQINYKESFELKDQLQTELREIKKEHENLKIDYIKELTKGEKIEAELVHYKGHIKRCDDQMAADQLKSAELISQIAEITNYTTLLRQDYDFCIINLKKSEKNGEKISLYAEELKNNLNQALSENKNLKNDIQKLEDFLSDYKDQIAKLRLEKSRLGNILQNIQSTISPSSGRTPNFDV